LQYQDWKIHIGLALQFPLKYSLTVYTKPHDDGKFNPAKTRNNHLAFLGGALVLKI